MAQHRWNTGLALGLAVVITSPVTEGTEVALPLMKLWGPDTSYSCSSCHCIIHRPLTREVNPWGVFNRGYGRQIGARLCWLPAFPGVLHLKEKKDSKETPQSPTVIIILLILLNLSVMSSPCLPACLPGTIKNPQVFVIQTLFPVGLGVSR